MTVGNENKNIVDKMPDNLSESIKIVVFTLGGRKYGLEILELQEIIKIPKIAPLPGTAEYVQGVTGLRGKVVVVLDLEKKFHFAKQEDTAYRRLVIVNISGDLFGILIEGDVEILEINKKVMKNPTTLLDLSSQKDCFRGIIAMSGEIGSVGGGRDIKSVNSGGVIIMLDLPKIVADQDLPRVQ